MEVTRAGEVPTTLKTVERALTVLEIVATSAEPLQVRDIAEQLGHNLSSTYHIVNTLLTRGYLDREPGGTLHVGPKAGLLASSLERSNDFGRQLRPYLERLSTDCGETVALTKRVGYRAVVQVTIDGNRPLRVGGLPTGYSGSEERRPSGRAVLAFVPAAEVEALLAHDFAHLPADEVRARLEALMAELQEIRAMGYVLDEGRYEKGICCVAAPFFDASGTVAGSVVVSAPSIRAHLVRQEIRTQVIATCRAISLSLHAPVVSDGRALA